LKKGSNIQELGNILNERTKSLIDIQTHWCNVKSVDWDKKLMIAVGLVDDLPFYDVNLGIGSIYKKPKLKTKCLIGIINNNLADAFLIDCDEIEQIELVDKTGFKLCLNNGLLTINGDQFGGIVNAIELKTQIDKNTLILEKLQEVFTNWIPIPQDGGSALKSLVTSFTTLGRANLSNIKNDKIKHG
jgi:hypothetical protein